MSLDKAIKYKKEKRRPYYGAKAIDSWCRNHGRDDWAYSNRTHKNRKRLASVKDRLDNFIRRDEDICG